MRALPASLALLACLSLAAGCGDSDDEPSGRATPQESPATSRPSENGTGTASPTTSPTASPSTGFAALTDRLLPTSEVPGLNDAWVWQDGETGPAGDEPFGQCAQVDLAGIGAEDVVERTYFPPDDSDDNAAEQVAEFPDEATALRAWSVLAGWHQRCARTLPAATQPHVHPFEPVSVPAGSARWYLLSWAPDGEETGRFEALGMTRNGTRVAVLRITNSGQDYNYPAGQEPMVGMLRAAAARLG